MSTSTVPRLAERGAPARGRKPFLDRIAPSMYEVLARVNEGAQAPLISVVVPVRNRADLVADTIDGLLRQDFGRPYEVIVVDNASDDGTADVLRLRVRAADAPFTAVRLHTDRGPATSRNVGITLARGAIVAFTDSDCVPSPGWLRSCVAAIEGGAGVVQGRTLPPEGQPQPLFNHFIETTRFDGSFSTSNVAYRRDALLEAGGFDPECDYWEDVDLGWRVTGLGWEARFAPEALVYHQVLTLSPGAWLRHAARVGNYPAKVARYPEFRRHLSARLWVDPSLALFQVFVLGLALGSQKRPFLLMTLPYLVSLATRKRFVGRRPPLRAAAYIARDAVSLTALFVGSVRHRTVVL